MGLTSEARGDRHQNWWQLSSIQLSGGIIGIPFILIGGRIFPMEGWVSAVLSIIFGNLLGLLLGYFFTQMSGIRRLNAVETAQQFIGPVAGRILGFCILGDMIGWLALGLSHGSEYLKAYPLFSQFSPGPIAGAIGSLFLLRGIRGLKSISVSAIGPLLILLFIIIFFGRSHNETHIPLMKTPGYAISGVSLILAASISAVVDYPTFFRHSKSKKDSVVALFVIFIFTSIIQFLGFYLFNIVDSSGLINNFPENKLFTNAIIGFVIISMITGTAWNAYAASIGWESLFPIYKDRTEYAVICLLAVVFSGITQIAQIIASLTVILGIAISALGGIMVFQFLNERRKISSDQLKGESNHKKWNSGSWGVACSIGMLAQFNILSLKLDATLISLVAGFIISALAVQTRQIYRRLISR